MNNLEVIMNSIKSWLNSLFEGMALALFHPIKNSPPPNIGLHGYRDKPFKNNSRLWYT